MIARWFAEQGYEVSLVTWDEGQAADASVAGVRVIKMCRAEAGLPGLRFWHPRWTSLVRALRMANADLYQYASANRGLGQLVLWCRARRRVCVFLLLADAGVDPRLPHLSARRERVLYRYGLRHVDRVMVQTCSQQERLRLNFGAESTPVPMPGEALAPTEHGVRDPAAEPLTRVIWVGRFSGEKRLEWLLDVAEQCPEVGFDVVGAPNAETRYATELARRAAAIPNVSLHGRISDNGRLAALYRQAGLLCCTSTTEGFPNTFLEAWSHGLPIVSTFDPDGLIAGRGLGAAADSVPGLVEGIRGLLRSPARYRIAAERARRHYLENHTVAAALPRIERVFLEALGAGDASGHSVAPGTWDARQPLT